jgi:ornithine cyclodeaminase/alanine dehydrogenase-like protein (mu-crystallin family)
MTLLLTNEDLENLLDMRECIAALEVMYANFAKGAALELDRIDAILPVDQDNAYNFKTMTGIDPGQGIVALRVVSDISRTDRRVKLPMAPGGRWVGLVFLFSTRLTQLLAIVQDGYIQSFRVGATTGLGAKYLARKDARTYGLIGTGQQASAQIDAMVQVRSLEKIKVYSPNKLHRAEFAEKWRKKLKIEVIEVGSACAAVADADIVGCATNSVEAVVEGDAFGRGAYKLVSGRGNFPKVFSTRVDKCFVNSLSWARRPNISFSALETQVGCFLDDKDLKQGSDLELNQDSMLELKDLIGGLVPGRDDNKEITCFYNNVGIGLQLEAVASLAYQKAKARGLGKELPDHWFSQNLHS